MAVGFDANSPGGSTIETGNLTLTHTPVGSPRGVVVFIVQNVGTGNEISSVTYGTKSLSPASGSPHAHTTGEPGAVYVYFATGTDIPTGQQTVTVTVSGSSAKCCYSVTLTGAVDLELIDIDTSINSDSVENPSTTLSLGGRTAWCGIIFHSGQNSPGGITPSTNWTSIGENDFASQTGGCYRYTILDTADVTAGWTQLAEDAVAMAVAVSEVLAGGGMKRRSALLTMGVG